MRAYKVRLRNSWNGGAHNYVIIADSSRKALPVAITATVNYLKDAYPDKTKKSLRSFVEFSSMEDLGRVIIVK
jgi:hypothetical protein